MGASLDDILTELRKIVALLESAPVPTPSTPQKKTITTRLPDLDPDIAEEIENHIVPEWWYEKYGEDPHPAKYMDVEGFGFSSEELAFLQGCLRNLTQRPPLVNGGTHRFEYVGKKYCKAERNSVACYACVRVD